MGVGGWDHGEHKPFFVGIFGNLQPFLCSVWLEKLANKSEIAGRQCVAYLETVRSLAFNIPKVAVQKTWRPTSRNPVPTSSLLTS